MATSLAVAEWRGRRRIIGLSILRTKLARRTEIFIRRRSNIDAIRKLQQSRAAVPMLMKSRYVSKQIPRKRRLAAGTVIFKCT